LSVLAPPAAISAVQSTASRQRVDASGAAVLGEQLPEGLAQLLKRVPHWYLDLHPRGDAIRLPEAFPVPYPRPVTGLQAITNHLRRYTGGGIERAGLAYPVRASGESYSIGYRFKRVYASHLDDAPQGLLFAALLAFTSPVSLRGQLALVHEPEDFERGRRNAWIYSAAQRRVRRAPDLAYDAISDGSEGMLTADQVDGYNGSPDRYDWVLHGLHERIVPYGASETAAGGTVSPAWLARGSVQPHLFRFEMRTVWVLEALLRPGQTHIYPRRRFYIDPDCWTVLLEEAWSSRGTLWRVAVHAVTSLPQPGGPLTRLSVYHDLDAGHYFATGFNDPADPHFRVGVRASMAEFTPEALRRIALRFV
jgi:hypothetical protein